jgi:hypothetical protein
MGERLVNREKGQRVNTFFPYKMMIFDFDYLATSAEIVDEE